MRCLRWFLDNVVMIVVGVLVIGLIAFVMFRSPAGTEALASLVEECKTLLGEIRKDITAKPADSKGPAKASPQKLADPAEVREGIDKAAADAYKAGLEKTGLRTLTREEIMKMADEAVNALTKTK